MQICLWHIKPILAQPIWNWSDDDCGVRCSTVIYVANLYTNVMWLLAFKYLTKLIPEIEINTNFVCVCPFWFSIKKRRKITIEYVLYICVAFGNKIVLYVQFFFCGYTRTINTANKLQQLTNNEKKKKEKKSWTIFSGRFFLIEYYQFIIENDSIIRCEVHTRQIFTCDRKHLFPFYVQQTKEFNGFFYLLLYINDDSEQGTNIHQKKTWMNVGLKRRNHIFDE